jgi:hypothetical protein
MLCDKKGFQEMEVKQRQGVVDKHHPALSIPSV